METTTEPVETTSDGDPAEISPGKGAGTPSVHRFDHYELFTRNDGTPVELGRGAMGVTYKAFDTNLRCPVALKVINPRYLYDESVRARFVREARAAARLRHPHVASVFHLGTKGGHYFYAMEFVEGETLGEVIHRQGPLGVDVAVEVVAQVAAALGAANKEQIVHRDIKPSNLMLCFGQDGAVTVKVIDFGLSKVTSPSQSDPGLSAPGTFAGTALFASPEQCSGAKVDIRSDIYSLGVTLWQMLTAKLPFEGTAPQLIHQHLHAPLPFQQLKQLPHPVCVLLQFMLEKDPARRPQTPDELQSALRAMKKALDAPQRPEFRDRRGISQPGRKVPSRRWNWLPAGIGVALLLLAAALGLNWYFSSPRSLPAPTAGSSVAVLPFDNLSGDKENEYFSDGLTSEVIYRLSGVPDLRVIARGSVLQYKAIPPAQRKSLGEIGTELDVGAILESSVQRVGNRIKVITILYGARAGRRLWGSSYDRDLKDVFAIQSDLAEQIAVALHATLSAERRANLQQNPTENVNAYDLYLRGEAASHLDRKEDNDHAVEFFEQALAQDPRFGLAYVGLAGAYIDRVKRFQGEAFWLDSAVDLCQQAIALDPKQLRAYTTLANAFNLKGSFDRMDGPVRTALELAPNDWDANRMAAAEFTELRREPEMYASIRKCFVTNPQDSWAPYELALICWTVSETVLAEQWMQRAINLEADPQKHHLMEAERLVYRGDYASARPQLKPLPPDLKTQYATVSDLVLFCSLRLGDWTAAISALEARLKANGDNPTALLRLALARRGAGQEDEANGTAERAVTLARQSLPTTKAPRWMRFDLAVGLRLLDRKDEAYQFLRELVAHGGFPHPVLGTADPGLAVFASDREYQSILADLRTQNEVKRTRILEIEQGF
ncbi:MAG: protein kinase [Verrucomicrobia bacterium]|nr:protein kinase [Verrucomicrobiota bacterium]